MVSCRERLIRRGGGWDGQLSENRFHRSQLRERRQKLVSRMPPLSSGLIRANGQLPTRHLDLLAPAPWHGGEMRKGGGAEAQLPKNPRAKGPMSCQPGATPQVSNPQMKQGLKARPTGCRPLHKMEWAFGPDCSFVRLFPGRCPGLASGRSVGAQTTRDVKQRVAEKLKTETNKDLIIF